MKLTSAEKIGAAKNKKRRAINHAVEALNYSYGYIKSHLVWCGRSVEGDSGLQQISAALNGLGATTPK